MVELYCRELKLQIEHLHAISIQIEMGAEVIHRSDKHSQEQIFQVLQKWKMVNYLYNNSVVSVHWKILVCDEGPSIFAELLKIFSVLLILGTMPVSLFFIVKVVQVFYCTYVLLTTVCSIMIVTKFSNYKIQGMVFSMYNSLIELKEIRNKSLFENHYF